MRRHRAPAVSVIRIASVLALTAAVSTAFARTITAPSGLDLSPASGFHIGNWNANVKQGLYRSAARRVARSGRQDARTGLGVQDVLIARS